LHAKKETEGSLWHNTFFGGWEKEGKGGRERQTDRDREGERKAGERGWKERELKLKPLFSRIVV